MSFLSYSFPTYHKFVIVEHLRLEGRHRIEIDDHSDEAVLIKETLMLSKALISLYGKKQ